MIWTEEQVRALVTDTGTLKRGLDLAMPPKWSNLGRTDTTAWGECAGSGSKPYQVGIDLTEPAFKCSCPSRVFPCKHGAGLLLLMARQAELFTGTTPPPWLAEWLDKRQQTQSKKATPAPAAKATATETAAPSSTATADVAEPEVAGLVSEARLQRMQRGAAELLMWLQDLISAGLAQTENQPRTFWENQAARLVDDQLPGLAAVLRELATLRYAGLDWPERLLARLGELYLLVRAFLRLAQLPPELQQDVLQLVGINIKKEDVLAQQPTVADTWLVVGQVTKEEERLLVRRTWLWGQATNRYALVLEYSFGGQAFATALVPVGQYVGSLAFYPSACPLRAVPTGSWTFNGIRPQIKPASSSVADFLDAYAAALGQLPWLREWPVTLHEVVPQLSPNEQATLYRPAEQLQLPLRCDAEQAWQLLAISGGHPLTVFGEWNGHAFFPIMHWTAPVVATTAVSA
ncbi:SWIM zinc finger family protein [Hymenobacter cavernae]|uniref:SWIM-type domain-containing protein n=1 Tax=Hymenobacter cavernae TaxID=2044852 RepID=A0ABQ1TZ50_9BACT|nr:SWIM zinc finger family protein [Hymenobacter cavernae]GGF07496.1 hypothetical protein GCM10011383_18220 [Hymenobacter cavernae]